MTARTLLVAGLADRKRGAFLLAVVPVVAWSAPNYQVFVSNERSGDLTIINSGDFSVAATLSVGKRPRGIHVSPDGKTVFVAVSGTPIGEAPQLDAKGNPMIKKGKGDDDDDNAGADKAADGIAIVDVTTLKLKGKINAGSDPEEFDLSKDGTQIYVSNEDTKSTSVIDIASAKVAHIIPVGQEPEGVTTTPDGKHFYVTCEAGGDIFVIDTTTFKVNSHFKVEGRPRSVAFLTSAAIGFIPSESAGQLNVIDTANPRVLKTITLPPGSRPMRVRVAPSGDRVYLSNGRAGTLSVIDAQTDELVDTIKVGARPWGIAISPDGKFLFAANGPSNDLSVVELLTRKEVAKVKVGSSPWGVVVVPTPP